MSYFYYTLCKLRRLSVILYVSYVCFISFFELLPCLPYLSMWTLCTLQLVHSTQIIFVDGTFFCSQVVFYIILCSKLYSHISIFKQFGDRSRFWFKVHYLIKSIRTSLCNSKLKPRCHYDRAYWYKRRQKAVCCSLLSSTSIMCRSGELSDFEHGLVSYWLPHQ
jgi:hypothetical protein